MRARFVLFCLLGLTFSCGKDEVTKADAAWPALGQVADSDPDPQVTHLALSARATSASLRDGSSTAVYRYLDRQRPDPASPGLHPLLIDLEVGERLIVDFKNELEEPTTIHWHGIRLPANMDGNPAAVDHNAPHGVVHNANAVPPGGTFTYDFAPKDAGLFWFHPHLRSDEQVDKGLYGVIRVRPKGSPRPSEAEERILTLDDIDLDGTEAQHRNAMHDDVAQLGRGGATILVNGVVPEGPLPLSRTTLLRLVNVANGRFFNLALPEHDFLVVGTDGGRYPEPFVTDHLVIVPGERIDAYLIPRAGADDKPRDLVTLPFDRGHGSAGEPPRHVAQLRVTGSEDARQLASVRPFEPPARVQSPDSFSIVLGQKEGTTGTPIFTFNGETWPDVNPIEKPANSTWEFEVKNETKVPHPFHLHGFFFQILSRDGIEEPPGRRVAKDSILIPAESSVRLAATFDEAGLWMMHCHILEHAEHGMMGHLLVE